MHNPLICKQVEGAMTDIQRAAAAGFTYCRSGFVPIDEAQALAETFERRHQVSATPDQRNYRRSKKQAVYKLIMYPVPNRQEIAWWLMKTEGADCDNPKLWEDIRLHRLEWIWWYELVRLPVPPAHRKKYAPKADSETQKNKKSDSNSRKKEKEERARINAVTWTWRIKPVIVKGLKQQIRFLVTKQDQRLAQQVMSIRKAPGFRGIRQDVYGLYGFTKRQCRIKKKTCPDIPQTIPWVRNQHYARVPLSTLVARAKKGASSWFPE
ncbi:hypothetical protein [Polycyclovorans algicola]|uniref:hypothetical protein n=1 Tax=Polycyclovorans algicola TaxID=616992 RepID=UPI00126970D9|nr:hypothetical protein [Polycyclovorans algicola]